MNDKARAFTLVELLIVIVVLGILATLVTLGMTKVQESARNSQRHAATLQVAEALEKYYDEHGEYPACTSLQAPLTTITTTTLKGIEGKVLVAPRATDKNVSSVICGAFTSSDAYAYIGDGCMGGSACQSWTLRYREEGSGATKETKSRRSGNVAVSEPTPSPSPTPGSNVSPEIPLALSQIETICNNTGVAVPGYNPITVSSGNVSGTSGNDVIWAPNAVFGQIDAGDGNDIICLMGTAWGNIIGGNGHDAIYAVVGGMGNIGGNDGNDVLISASGFTGAFDGGAGNDTFYVSTTTGNVNGNSGTDRATILNGSTINGTFSSIEEMF